MAATRLALIFLASITASAATTPATICTSTQCLEGTTESLLVATLSSPSNSSPILLLPDTYASSSSLPSQLLSALQSPLTTLSVPSTLLNASAGASSSISLPLTISPSGDLLSFSGANFTGAGVSTSLPPTNTSFSPAQINTASIMLRPGTWAVVSDNSSANSRAVIWDSISDSSQLSSSLFLTKSSSFTVLDLQSSSCTAPCSSSGTCSASGTCTCREGFTGSSCETCAKGFFGPTCQACPSDCALCDEGLGGTGKCLAATATNPPSSCNCLNGVCSSSGTCTCSSGWANTSSTSSSSSGNSTLACSTCADGFFKDSSGECRACALNCEKCSSGGTNGAGACTTCKSGFTPSSIDPSQCVVNAIGSSSCPDGQFLSNGACSACNPLCKTCSGPLSTDCTICSGSKTNLNGQCVDVSASGVCTPPIGSSSDSSDLVANNSKNKCDACPGSCTACSYPVFNTVSTLDQVQCTACLPGMVLSSGKCISKCPDGSFVDPKDGFTCSACDSSCKTCAGSSTTCLTCSSSSLFALDGSCKSSCPSTHASSSLGACIACHPDCATCSVGGAFDKCTACPSSRPVLSLAGRCLPTCAKSEFFDATANKCVSCDSSCSSCSTSGSSGCMTCPAGKALKGGACVDAGCAAAGVVKALGGVCLSSLVTVTPKASNSSGTSTTSPSPTPVAAPIPRPTPTVVSDSSGGWIGSLSWWQVALIVLGSAALCVLALLLWRRKARAARQQDTRAFREQRLEKTRGWRGWFGLGAASRSSHSVSSRASKRIGVYGGRRGGGAPQSSSAHSVEAWRYEMENMERGGYLRRRSSAFTDDLDDYAGRQGRRGDNVLSKHLTASSTAFSNFTSPTSPRERTFKVALSPEDGIDKTKAKLRPYSGAWTAPSVYSQATEARPQVSRKAPPPLPDLGPFDTIPLAPSIPQPRQPIKDTSTARYSGIGGGYAPPVADLAPSNNSFFNAASWATSQPQQQQPLVDAAPVDPLDMSNPPLRVNWMGPTQPLVPRGTGASNASGSRNPFRQF